MDHNSAFALGLLTHLVEPSEVDGTVKSLVETGKPAVKYAGKPADSEHPVAVFASQFFSNENMDILLSGGVPEGFDAEDRNVIRQVKSLRFAAPIAVKMAADLLNDAVNTGDDLQAGLALELERLETIFATADAHEGLSALIEGRRPQYSNS
jgi:hypothetical protein